MTTNALPPSRKSAAFLGLALLLTALLPASLQAATDVHDARDVKLVQIGFAGPLSGSSAQMGQSQAHAVELALAEINARRHRRRPAAAVQTADAG